MNATPNGIRAESKRIRLASIDVLNSTSLHGTFVGHPCLSSHWRSATRAELMDGDFDAWCLGGVR